METVRPRPHRAPLAVLLAVALGACGPPQEGASGTLLPPLSLDAVGPTPVLPGTRLRLVGSGFVGAGVADVFLVFRGTVAGRAVEFGVRPERLDDATLVLPVLGDLAAALIPEAGTYAGDIVVRREPVDGAPADEARLAVALPVAPALAPVLTAVGPTVLHPGDVLRLDGDGFLHPGEGVSLVELDGTLTTVSPPATRDIEGLLVPARPPDPLSRDALELVLTPDILGIRPGTFTGVLRVHNEPAAAPARASAALDPGPLRLDAPVVEAVAPLSASRGQWVDVTGQGLLPPDALLESGTLLLLEGTFRPARGPAQDWTGVRALALLPDEHVDSTLASIVLRVDRDEDGDLVGLGRDPGVFEGTVAPMVFAGPDAVLGAPRPLTFTVGLPRQLVYLRFLPTFDDALAEFGLEAERERVVARILEVTARDYAGINVGFVVEPPEDFAEYGIVEIGGHDPNGTGLFGLDNTAGKDVGNVRFDDVIGGFNADTRARGFAAFGGIFVAEMLSFSPRIGEGQLASPRFDDVFGPLSPPLGGTPARPGEADGGPRADVVREAVRVLGNLVGNTVTHEVGHSLGLAAIDGQFHNVGDNPGWIMDAGIHRPFEERAELDGQGPAVFSPFNRAYLEEILPAEAP